DRADRVPQVVREDGDELVAGAKRPVERGLGLLAVGHVEGGPRHALGAPLGALEDGLPLRGEPADRAVRPHDAGLDREDAAPRWIERRLERALDALPVLGVNGVEGALERRRLAGRQAGAEETARPLRPVEL